MEEMMLKNIIKHIRNSLTLILIIFQSANHTHAQVLYIDTTSLVQDAVKMNDCFCNSKNKLSFGEMFYSEIAKDTVCNMKNYNLFCIPDELANKIIAFFQEKSMTGDYKIDVYSSGLNVYDLKYNKYFRYCLCTKDISIFFDGNFDFRIFQESKNFHQIISFDDDFTSLIFSLSNWISSCEKW